MRLACLVFAIVVPISACAIEDLELGSVESALKPEPGEGGCPTWGCGSNSPAIDALSFHDLSVTGDFDDAGFALIPYAEWTDAQGVVFAFRPTVENAELVLRDLDTGNIKIRHDKTVGTHLFIYNNVTQIKYTLRIDEVTPIALWAHPNGATITTYAYHMLWQNPRLRGETNLCAVPLAEGGLSEFFAVLFEGDRIDADRIEVTGEDTTWFNIGCAGHTLAKQHLSGHTLAAKFLDATLSTTIEERTANLKMYAADYCGNGHPFTVAGQPLEWADDHLWYSTVQNPQTADLEARWTMRGASCLNHPRVDAHPTNASDIPFPYGVNALLDPALGWCEQRPPYCAGTADDFAGAHVVSVNP